MIDALVRSRFPARRTIGAVLFFIVLWISCLSPKAFAQQSLIGTWEFSATSPSPSTSLYGHLEIFFDSATHVLGVLTIEGKHHKFFGRHLESRLLGRTDSSSTPVVRFDATFDSSALSMSGELQASQITAIEHRKKRIYTNVLYAVYATKEDESK